MLTIYVVISFIVLTGILTAIIRPQIKRKGLFGGLAFGLAALGVILVISEHPRVESGLSQKNWPTVDGTVIDAEMDPRNLLPLVRYQYTVDGQGFEGRSYMNAPGFGFRSERRDVAAKIIETVEPGKSITVHYAPKQPQNSVLVPGLTWDVLTRLSFACCLMTAGCWLLACVSLSKQDANNAAPDESQ